jgi:hypothetical protein
MPQNGLKILRPDAVAHPVHGCGSGLVRTIGGSFGRQHYPDGGCKLRAWWRKIRAKILAL